MLHRPLAADVATVPGHSGPAQGEALGSAKEHTLTETPERTGGGVAAQRQCSEMAGDELSFEKLALFQK